MEEMLSVVNRMRDAGIITDYAIGGAMGAVYYLEAVSTIDVDIFISFDDLKSSPLNPLGPIFNFLRPLGFVATGEHIKIAGELVQFLPAADELLQDALENAVGISFHGVQTRVMTAEHLMAIALRLGRPKDLARIAQFVELDQFDESKLKTILARHGLSGKWENFRTKYG